MLHPRPSDLRIRFKDIPNCQEGGCHVRVWRPEGLTAESTPPVVLMLHGGAFAFGQDHNIPPAELEYFNAKGAVVVSAQYRLAPHVTFPEIVDDLIDAYAWVLSSLAGQLGCKGVGKVAVIGWSAGATSVCFVAQFATRRGLPAPAALMVTYGLFDFDIVPKSGAKWDESLTADEMAYMARGKEGDVWVGSSHDIEWTEDILPRRVWGQHMLHKGWLLPYLTNFSSALNAEYNPYPNLSSSFPPTAILGATADTLIDVEQTRLLHRRLNELGVDNVLAWAEGMPHGAAENIAEDEASLKAYGAWFESATRGCLDFVLQRILP